MHSSFRALTALTVGILILTGCSRSASVPQPSPTAAASAPLAWAAPEAFRGKSIVVTTGANNPPLYFTDADGRSTGLTREIAEAAAQLLGLELEINTLSFDTVIPALQTGAIDIGIYGLDLSIERIEIIDMVSYFSGGHSILTYDRNLQLPDDTSALCGLRFGGIAGSSWIDSFVSLNSDICPPDNPLTVVEFKDQLGANVAAESGEIDGAVIASIAGDYTVKNDSSWSLTGPTIAVKPVGMGFTKGSGLAEAFHIALNELIENGTYEKIFQKYGVEAEAVSAAQLNNLIIAKDT